MTYVIWQPGSDRCLSNIAPGAASFTPGEEEAIRFADERSAERVARFIRTNFDSSAEACPDYKSRVEACSQPRSNKE